MTKHDILNHLAHFKSDDEIHLVFKDGENAKNYRRFEIDFVVLNTANFHLKEIKEKEND